MGQRIVRELGITNDVDTLGRWISHRVAELIERAEQATTDADRELARRECADLIIRLWEHRSERSYARPLAHIRGFLEKFTLERSSYQSRSAQAKEHTWLDVLPHIEQLAERERLIYRDAAIAGVSIEQEREWLEEHKDDLSDDEQQVTKIIIELYDGLRNEYYRLDDTPIPNFAGLSPKERTTQAIIALDQINRERQSLIDALKLSGGYADKDVASGRNVTNTDRSED